MLFYLITAQYLSRQLNDEPHIIISDALKLPNVAVKGDECSGLKIMFQYNQSHANLSPLSDLPCHWQVVGH